LIYLVMGLHVGKCSTPAHSIQSLLALSDLPDFRSPPWPVLINQSVSREFHFYNNSTLSFLPTAEAARSKVESVTDRFVGSRFRYGKQIYGKSSGCLYNIAFPKFPPLFVVSVKGMRSWEPRGDLITGRQGRQPIVR